MLNEIVRYNLPCWSSLWLNLDPLAVDLFIHNDAAQHVTDIPPRVLEIFRFQEAGRFSDVPGKDWGFDSALKLLPPTRDGFVGYRATIPTMTKYGPGDCVYCQGTGKDKLLGNDCLRCRGTKKEVLYDFGAAQKISASLTILTFVLETRMEVKNPTRATTPQLLTFRTSSETGRHDIGGYFGRRFVDWLKAKGETELSETKAAMDATRKQIDTTNRYYGLSMIQATHLGGGRLQLVCGTGGCYIHTDTYGADVSEESGCGFVPHNVDHLDQQLTFLVALAALETQARRELGL